MRLKPESYVIGIQLKENRIRTLHINHAIFMIMKQTCFTRSNSFSNEISSSNVPSCRRSDKFVIQPSPILSVITSDKPELHISNHLRGVIPLVLF